MITDIVTATLCFDPLTSVDRDILCSKLNISNQSIKTVEAGKEFTPMGNLCQSKKIKGDGNCFFRELSFVICGNENQHLKGAACYI